MDKLNYEWLRGEQNFYFRYKRALLESMIEGSCLNVGCGSHTIEGALNIDEGLPRLPYPDGSFDTVICSDVLEHIGAHRQAMGELLRIARKKVIITVPAYQWLYGAYDRLLGHKRRYTAKDFSGFETSHLFWFLVPVLYLRKVFQLRHRPLPRLIDNIFLSLCRFRFPFGTTILAVKRKVPLEAREKSRVSFLIPVFNEARTIDRDVKTVEYILRKLPFEYEIFIVDDSSSDTTARIADAIARSNKKVALLHYGIGPTRRENLARSFARTSGDIIVFVDVDLITSLRFIPDLIDQIVLGYDIATGSRYIQGARIQRKPVRFLMSIFYNWLMRRMFGTSFHDHMCGFKAFKRPVALRLAEDMGYDATLRRGIFWDTELLVRALQSGYRVKEIPIWWRERNKSALYFKREIQAIPYIWRFFCGHVRRSVCRHKAQLLLAAAVLFIGAAGYYQAFSVFFRHDDEGLVMYALRNFLSGHALYDGIYTQYGPAYFVLHDAFFRITRLPIAHDIMRFLTLGSWCLGSLLLALFTRRVSRRTAPAVIVLLTAFTAVGLTVREPGHPQGMLYVLIALWILLLSYLRPKRGIIFLGITAGLIACSKINAGLFCLLAAVWLACAGMRGERGRIVKTALCGAMIFIPFFLMRQRLGDPLIFQYALIGTFTILNLFLMQPQSLDIQCSRRSWQWLLPCAFLAVCFLFGGIVLSRGTTIAGLYYGIFAQHLNFARTFWMDPRITPGMVSAGVVSVAAAFMLGLRPQSGFWGWLSVRRAGTAVKLIYAVAIVIMGLNAPARFGLEACGGYLMPWIWLVLLPYPLRKLPARRVFIRYALLVTAAFQFLLAYPIAGTQMEFALVLLVPAAGILLADVLEYARILRLSGGGRRPYVIVTAAIYAVAAFALYSVTARGIACAAAYYGYSAPVNLSGSSLLRYPQNRLAALEGLTLNIREHAGPLVTVPGMYSFCFWSGVDSPTLLNQTNWPFVFNEQQQQRLIRDIAAAPRTVVVYNKHILRFWQRDDAPGAHSAMAYIRKNFVPVVSISGYTLLLRPLEARDFRVFGAWQLALEDLEPGDADAQLIGDRTLTPVVISLPPLHGRVSSLQIVDSATREVLPLFSAVDVRDIDCTMPRRVIVFVRFPRNCAVYDAYVARVYAESGKLLVRLPFVEPNRNSAILFDNF